jgi:hypothetical protein
VVLPSEEAAARAVLRVPQARRALAELQPLAVLPEPREQAELPACRASHPAAFRPKQKGKRKVQQVYPQAFLPQLDEAAAFPQNRWS